jgi:hypothetical protein
MQDFDAVLGGATMGQCKISELNAGLDKDAPLTTRFTGVPLDEFIPSAAYR